MVPPFEYRPLKSPVFKCFRFSKGRFSDPHCSYVPYTAGIWLPPFSYQKHPVTGLLVDRWWRFFFSLQSNLFESTSSRKRKVDELSTKEKSPTRKSLRKTSPDLKSSRKTSPDRDSARKSFPDSESKKNNSLECRFPPKNYPNRKSGPENSPDRESLKKEFLAWKLARNNSSESASKNSSVRKSSKAPEARPRKLFLPPKYGADDESDKITGRHESKVDEVQ